jgi:RimJ/RimL family protein N-acetyltransferase
VERLFPSDIGDLNRLYQLGFASWLPSSSIADGVYYGIHAGGRLVAAAGTHVVSRNARLAVVGNVLTHVDFRGRGYATAVTGAVTAELLRTCDQVVLNVRSDNPPAIAAYHRLGYAEHVRFEERLVRRLGSPFPDLTAAFRRWFGPREPERSTMMAHPVAPPASLGLGSPSSSTTTTSTMSTPSPIDPSPVDATPPDEPATHAVAGPPGDEPPSPDEEPASP